MRFIASLLLTLLAGVAGAAVTTTINCKSGGDPFINKVTQATTISTENVVVIQVTPGHPVTVLMYDDQDWKYRSTTATATTDAPITALRAITLRFVETTTFYDIRTSADGTLTIIPLKVE